MGIRMLRDTGPPRNPSPSWPSATRCLCSPNPIYLPVRLFLHISGMAKASLQFFYTGKLCHALTVEWQTIPKWAWSGLCNPFFKIWASIMPLNNFYSPREVAYNNTEQYKQKQDRTDRTEKRSRATCIMWRRWWRWWWQKLPSSTQ